MKRRQVIESFSEDWPPKHSLLFRSETNLVKAEDFTRMVAKSDLERSWTEFVRWIGFSTLCGILQRKTSSIDQTCLKIISESIFSIEIGLLKIVKRWSTYRRATRASKMHIRLFKTA